MNEINLDKADPNNYSEVAGRIARGYVDRFSVAYIIFATSKALNEPFFYGDMYIPELENFIDFPETMELWEGGDIDILGKILVDGIYDYCVSVVKKYPENDKNFYVERWKKNVYRGLKNLNLKRN